MNFKKNINENKTVEQLQDEISKLKYENEQKKKELETLSKKHNELVAEYTILKEQVKRKVNIDSLDYYFAYTSTDTTKCSDLVINDDEKSQQLVIYNDNRVIGEYITQIQNGDKANLFDPNIYKEEIQVIHIQDKKCSDWIGELQEKNMEIIKNNKNMIFERTNNDLLNYLTNRRQVIIVKDKIQKLKK